MKSVPPTNLIAELHQFLDALLVGMIFLSVLKADRIEHQVAVDMLSVNMCCDYDFIFVESFSASSTAILCASSGSISYPLGKLCTRW